jgi:glycosyltransferase involved in cell wall biosynthesis
MTSPLEVSHVFNLSERPGRHVWGGAERHLRVLLPALVGDGVAVEAIVLATEPGPVIVAGLAELERAGVRVTRIDRPARRSLLRSLPAFAAQHFRLWRLLRRRREHIVHLHLDLLVAPVVAFAAGCRHVIMTLHVDDEAWRAWWWRLWLRLIDRPTVRYIAISERVRDHYGRIAGVATARVSVVPYGLPEPSPSACSRAAFGLPSDRFVVGFVGRLVEQKNLFLLLDALGGLDGVEVVLVGDGPLRGALEAHALQHGYANVRFLGAVEDAAQLMPLFDVLCLPSRFEGLGLVLLEAMLRDVPCLGSRAGAIPEVLGNGRYGVLADANDPRALRASVLAMRSDAAGRAQIVRAASDYVRSRHCVARMSSGIRSTYAGVIAACPTGAQDERHAAGARS